MTTHTAGPWRVGDAGHSVFGPPNGSPSPETVATSIRAKANARLIAAAPELLAALVQTLDAMRALRGLAFTGSRIPTDRYPEKHAADAADAHARAAIAKATGDQP